jgi:hypothetical protein
MAQKVEKKTAAEAGGFGILLLYILTAAVPILLIVLDRKSVV